jgi:uncharacterized protein (DUF2225 family)
MLKELKEDVKNIKEMIDEQHGNINRSKPKKSSERKKSVNLKLGQWKLPNLRDRKERIKRK